MHRWFFANEREICSEKEKKTDETTGGDGGVIDNAIEEDETIEIAKTDWPFCVTYTGELKGNEYIAVVGNCAALGNWNPQEAHIIYNTKGTTKFEGIITIPRNINIEYRYIICAWNPYKEELIVRRWETHTNPRVIRTCQNLLKDCDQFGIQAEMTKESTARAWATLEYYVHLKVFQAPFIWQSDTQKRLLHTKILPMYAVEPKRCEYRDVARVPRRSFSCQVDPVDEPTCDLFGQCNEFAFLETGNLSSDTQHLLRTQPEFGMPTGPEDFTLYHLSISNLKLTLYKIDLYTYAYKAADDEPPYHYGYGYIMPDQLIGTEGVVKVRITCASTHRPLCQMRVNYLIIKPFIDYHLDMKRTYTRSWPKTKLPLDIGHRGSGKTYVYNGDTVRENTVCSINRAAMHQADMVTIDVMLTMDRVPVVHSDHVVRLFHRVSTPVENLVENFDLFVFPMEHFKREQLRCLSGCSTRNKTLIAVQSLRHEDLRRLKAYRFASSQFAEITCEKLMHEQMPFQALEQIMAESAPQVGFIIDVKWVQQDSNNRWECNGYNPTFDRNIYVDTILQLVLSNAGKRHIIFSSYDCDTCAMLRFKQNLYGVMLRLRDPECDVQYKDGRVNNLDRAIYTAHALELYGLIVHENEFRRNSGCVMVFHQYRLTVFVAGDELADEEFRLKVKYDGAKGVVFDRIDQMNQVGEPLSRPQIYLLETQYNKQALKKLWKQELKKHCKYQTTSDEEAEKQKDRKRMMSWCFCLCYSGHLHGNEYVAVVGNCPQLGCWDPKNAVKMYHQQHTFKYYRSIQIPRTFDVEYRYIICALDPINVIFVVRQWETHLKPRIIRRSQTKPSKDCDQFGWHRFGDYKVERACLTAPAHIVQFRVFNAPFTFTEYYEKRELYVKVTRRTTKNINALKCEEECDELCPWFGFAEVCTVSSPFENHFGDQPEQGTRCGADDLVIFQVTVTHMPLTVYRFDFYTYAFEKPVQHDPRIRCGCMYVRAEQLDNSNDTLELEVKSPYTEEMLFTMKLDYLVVKPYPYQNFMLDRTYGLYWRKDKPPLEIGHRGCGRTYQQADETVRENTLNSFNRAAAHGAEMVELDVMLTKDLVPVVQHDHVLKLLPKPSEPIEKMLEGHDVFVLPMEHFEFGEVQRMARNRKESEWNIPFEAFTLEQLRQIQACLFAVNEGGRKSTSNQILHDQAPFATLEEILSEVTSPKLGFNIEVKWVLRNEAGDWADNGFPNQIDRNDYVDAILEVVLRSAGKRRIVFSSFDPDTCILLRCKQHRYPVMQLIRDPNDELQYADLRLKNYRHIVYMTQAMECLGLGMHVNTVLRDNWRVAFAIKRGLVVFCGFGPHESRQVRERVKAMGVKALIYDRIDQPNQAGTPFDEPYYIFETEANAEELAELQTNQLNSKCD